MWKNNGGGGTHPMKKFLMSWPGYKRVFARDLTYIHHKYTTRLGAVIALNAQSTSHCWYKHPTGLGAVIALNAHVDVSLFADQTVPIGCPGVCQHVNEITIHPPRPI